MLEICPLFARSARRFNVFKPLPRQFLFLFLFFRFPLYLFSTFPNFSHSSSPLFAIKLFFERFYFFPFSPQSPPVRSCIFFVVGPSSCAMWDAASVWFDGQCHVRAQDSNQRNTGPPAAEHTNLTTWPRGQPPTLYFCLSPFYNTEKYHINRSRTYYVHPIEEKQTVD